MEHFDALVIGSGQGGTPLSGAMAEHGWRTALVERRAVGGVCLNYGCVPTKTNVAVARVAMTTQRAREFGFIAMLEPLIWWRSGVGRKICFTRGGLD